MEVYQFFKEHKNRNTVCWSLALDNINISNKQCYTKEGFIKNYDFSGFLKVWRTSWENAGCSYKKLFWIRSISKKNLRICSGTAIALKGVALPKWTSRWIFLCELFEIRKMLFFRRIWWTAFALFMTVKCVLKYPRFFGRCTLKLLLSGFTKSELRHEME